MVECRRYSNSEINYVLSRILAGWKATTIAKAFKRDFAPYWDSKLFTKHQVSYIKNTYKKPPGSVKPHTGPIPRFQTSPSPTPGDTAISYPMFTDQDHDMMASYHHEDETALAGSSSMPMNAGDPGQQIQDCDIPLASVEVPSPQEYIPNSSASTLQADLDDDLFSPVEDDIDYESENGGWENVKNDDSQQYYEGIIAGQAQAGLGAPSNTVDVAQVGVTTASDVADYGQGRIFPNPMGYGSFNYVSSDATGDWYAGRHDGCSTEVTHHHNHTGGNQLRFASDAEFKQVMRAQAIAQQQRVGKPIVASQGLNAYMYNPYGFDVHGRDVEGYDAQGFDAHGFDCHGFNALGYNAGGKDILGNDVNDPNVDAVLRAPDEAQLGMQQQFGMGMPLGWGQQHDTLMRGFPQQNAQFRASQQPAVVDDSSLIDPRLLEQQPIHTVRAPVELQNSMLNTPVNFGVQSGPASTSLGSNHWQGSAFGGPANPAVFLGVDQQWGSDTAGLAKPAAESQMSAPNDNNDKPNMGHAAFTGLGPVPPQDLPGGAWEALARQRSGDASSPGAARAAADEEDSDADYDPESPAV